MGEQVKIRWVETIGSILAAAWIVAIVVALVVGPADQAPKMPPGDRENASRQAVYP